MDYGSRSPSPRRSRSPKRQSPSKKSKSRSPKGSPRQSPTKRNSRSPKQSPRRSPLSSLLINKKHRDVWGKIQREYLGGQDRLNLRPVAKIINFMTDRELDKLEVSRDKYFERMHEIMDQIGNNQRDKLAWVKQVDTTMEKLLATIKKLKENSIPLDQKTKSLIDDLLERGWIDAELNYIRNKPKK